MRGSEQTGATILLVEDDQPLADVLRDGLTAAGYVVCLALSGAAAEALLDSVKPDVMLIDLMLPDQHGLVLCANLKQRSSAPIIVYSRTCRREDAALAFKLGADDFVPKPVSMAELGIRIQRALQVRDAATAAARETVKAVGPLALDEGRRQVTVSGQVVATTPAEYRLLSILVERADQTVSIRELGEAVWAHYDSSLDASLRVHMRRVACRHGHVAVNGLTHSQRRELRHAGLAQRIRGGLERQPLRAHSSRPTAAD